MAGIFAGVALLLIAVGTYGVLSYAVAQRGREIGVRLALGARPEQIQRQFLVLGLRLLAWGGGSGLIGAVVAGRAMAALLFEVPAIHGPTLTFAAVVLSTIVLVAMWIPARRAAKVDPMVALRAE
jgi:ABC-type antimicrobial peptide transport system permease subunit